MSRYIFDIETDGLLDALTKVHSLVFKDIDTGQVYSCTDRSYKVAAAPNGGLDLLKGMTVVDGLKMLMEADLIVGHNIIEFDIPALQKVYPWFKPKGLVRDTLVLSRLIRADSKDHMARDWKLVKIGKFPGSKKKLIGRHSLESWGYRLGIWKGDYSEIKEAEAKAQGITDKAAIVRYVWGTWTQEMQEYCEQDVEVTAALWQHFTDKLANGWSDECVDLEHEVAWVIARQCNYGIGFDTEKAGKLYATLTAHLDRLTEELRQTFKPTVRRWTPKSNNKRYGYIKGKEIIEEIPFNPGSGQQTADRLIELGWKPTEYGKDGVPTLGDEILGQLPWPEAKKLAEYAMVSKRIGTLANGKQALLKNAHNGVIYPQVISNGAVTGRMTHKVVVNIPGPIDKKTGKAQPYGKEMRELFIARLGVLVGCDADSLEGRVGGGYMAKYDGGEFLQSVIAGDKKLGTDSHSRTAKALAKWNCHRETGKTYFYAMVFGAMDPKLGEILGATGKNKRKVGGESRKALMKNIPGLGKLIEAVQAKADTQGWIYGLDKRKLRIRSSNAALNTLFQSAGAILMKRALIILDTDLSGVKPSVIGTQGPEAATKLRPGTDYEFVLNYHDEWGIDTPEKNAPIISEKASAAIPAAGVYYNFRAPLKGNAKTGKNWFEIH